MKKLDFSRRSFNIVSTSGCKTNLIQDTFTWSLNDLLSEDNDYETAFALQDILDEVLDLRFGDALYFQPNRDNQKTKGIIVRVK